MFNNLKDKFRNGIGKAAIDEVITIKDKEIEKIKKDSKEDENRLIESYEIQISVLKKQFQELTDKMEKDFKRKDISRETELRQKIGELEQLKLSLKKKEEQYNQELLLMKRLQLKTENLFNLIQPITNVSVEIKEFITKEKVPASSKKQ